MITAIVNDHIDNKTLYREVNATSAKMSGNDNLGIWLKDPEAVTPRTAKVLAGIEDVLGREMMTIIYNAGLSANVYRLAVHVCRMCDSESPTYIKRVINWLIKYQLTGRVMKAIEGGQDPQIIMKAVRADRPIKMSLSVSSV